MEEIINNNKTLVPIRTGNTQLVKTNNAIQITNKLISKSIAKLFNQAFYLLNSGDLRVKDGKTLFENHELTYYGEEVGREIDTNFLFHFESDSEYFKKMHFRFTTNNDNCKTAIDLFSEALKISPSHKYCYFFILYSMEWSYEFTNEFYGSNIFKW